MSIAQALKFAQGAVSKKEFVPELTHFRIAGGTVMGYNGSLCLCAPVNLDLECCPKAIPFTNAVKACNDTAQLALTPSGKLSVRSGKFRASVDCVDVAGFPEVAPEGVEVPLAGNLLATIKALYEFTAEDASRPWAAGILLNGCSAYATNNVILVERWLGGHFPYCVNVPRAALREVLRIGEEPTHAQVTEGSITFHYTGGRWLRSQLASTEWPDVGGLLDRLPTSPANVATVPDGLWEALETLTPFLDELNQVVCVDGLLETVHHTASVEMPGMPDCSYNAKMLAMLQGVATRIDLQAWPNTAVFFGDNLRGAIAGMRVNV